MTNLRTSLFLVISGLGALGGVASAGGFYLNEHDARATGRAGASAATDTDPSAIVFNPGGIALGEGTAFSVGASLIAPSATYTDQNDKSTDTNGGPAVLPQAFITHRINKMFAAGIGFHAPYGLAISWPDDSPQADVITKQSLRSYYITPSVGVNLDEQVPGLSIGGGLDLVPATVELEKNIYFGTAQGHAHLGGTAFGIGGRVGVMYTPAALKQLSVGATWKSQVKLDFSGTGDFDMPAPYRSQLPPDGDIKTSVKLPQQITGGVAYRPIPALEFEADLFWINWSVFKAIDITLPDGSHSVAPQNYSNTLTLRVGGEYKLPKQKLAFRAGYIYDPTPIPASTISAQLPDANRNDITAGASYSPTKTLDIHAAVLVVLPSDKSASDANPYMPEYKGSYEVSAIVASLTLNGRFGN